MWSHINFGYNAIPTPSTLYEVLYIPSGPILQPSYHPTRKLAEIPTKVFSYPTRRNTVFLAFRLNWKKLCCVSNTDAINYINFRVIKNTLKCKSCSNMFRFTQEPLSGSQSQCLAKITSMVPLCLSI